MALERNARITVAPHSSASLYFDDERVIQLGAGSTITLTGRMSSEHRDRTVFSAVKMPIGGRRTELIPGPALRSGDDLLDPNPISPRSSDLLETRPAFAWQAAPGATHYVVTLRGDRGAVWSVDSDSAALEYPAAQPALAAGEYLWEVQAYGSDGL